MNKIYRAIWNETTQTWVAASELAKSKTKSDTVSLLPAANKGGSKSKLNILSKLGVITAVLNLSIFVPSAYASNAAIVGGTNRGTDGAPQSYPYGSHGSMVINGANDLNATGSAAYPYTCGADEVVGRGDPNRTISGTSISALDEYLRFAQNQTFQNNGVGTKYTPYGTTTTSVDASTDGITTTGTSGMQGLLTGGAKSKMPVAYGVYSFVSGCGAYASGNYSVAFGTNATATAGGAMAIGTAALASGRAAVAFGIGAQATGVSSVALGSVASSDGVGSVAAGLMSQASADGTVALGVQSQAKKDSALAIGNSAQANAEQSISIGSANQVNGKGSGAIGGSGTTTGFNSTDGTQTTAATGVTIVNGEGTYSFGNQNGTIAADNTGIFGNKNTIQTDPEGISKADNIRILGSSNTVSAQATGAMIVGNTANVSAANALALGNNTQVSGTNGVAIGQGASAKSDDSIALGSGSVASTSKGVAGYNPSTSVSRDAATASPVWNSTANAVAIGDVASGLTRQITGLAAGTQDTDAVNVAQLKSLGTSTSTSLSSLSSSTSTGLSTTNSNLTDFLASASTSISTTTSNLTDLTNSITTRFNQANSDITSLNTSASTGIKHLQEDALQWNTKELAYDASHAASGAKTARIINVSAGDITAPGSTDAVNGGQLYATNTELASLSTSSLGSISSAVANFNSTSVSVSTTLSSSVNQLNTLVTSTSTSLSQLNIDALQLKNGMYDASRNGEAQKITNIAAGDISKATSTDVVNGGQLFTTNSSLSRLSTSTSQSIQDANTKRDSLSTSVGTVLDTTNKTISSLSVATGNSIGHLSDVALQLNGDVYDASYGGSNRKVTNVAAGDISKATSSDLVTGGQLFTTNKSISTLASTTSSDLQSANADLSSLSTSIDTNITTLSTALSSRVDNVVSNINTNLGNVSTSLSSVQSSTSTGIKNLKSDALQWDDNLKAFSALRGSSPQKITQVAAGDITSVASTDAVNGAQLYTTNSNLTVLSGSVSTGLSQLSDQIISSTTADINKVSLVAGTISNSVTGLQSNALLWKEGAYDARHGDVDQKITHVKAGSTDQASTDAINGGQLYSLSTVTAGKLASTTSTVNSSLADTSTKLTAVKDQALLWNSTKTAYDASRSGNAQKITGVAGGDLTADSSEVVIGAQLYTTNTTLDTLSLSTTNSLSSLNTALQNSSKSVISSLSSAVGDSQADIANLQKNALQWSVADKAYSARNGGENQRITNVMDGTLAANSTDVATGRQLYTLSSSTVESLNSLSTSLEGLSAKGIQSLSTILSTGLQSANTNISALQKDALQWNNDIGAYDASHGLANTTQKITNVADGILSADSSDVVTGKQLFATNTSVSSLTDKLNNGLQSLSGSASTGLDNISANLNKSLSTGLSSLSTAAENSLTTTNTNLNSLKQNALQWNNTVNAYDASHGATNEKQRITNVADGSATAGSSDVVTGGQLYTTNTAVSGLSTSMSTGLNTLSTATSNDLIGLTNTLDNSLKSGLRSLSTTLDNNLASTSANVAALQKNALQWNSTASAYDASHGAIGGSEKITNVADASLGANSSDVVTGGQLYTTNSTLSDISSSTFNTLGSISSSASTGISSISTALNNFADSKISSLSSSFDAKLTATNTSLSTLQQNALLWNGDLKAYDATHNGQAQRITNVLDGNAVAGSSDVVTGGQLFTTNSNLTSLSGSVSTTFGELSSSLQDISNNSLAGLKDELNKTNIKLNDLTTSTSTSLQTTNSNIGVLQQNTLLWNKDLNGGQGAYDASHNGIYQRITNVKDGILSADSSDVVTGGQLFTTNTNVSKLSGSISSISDSVVNGLSSLSSSLTEMNTNNLASLSTGLNDTNNRLTELSTTASSSLKLTNANVNTLQQNALLWNDSLGNGGAYDARHGTAGALGKITNVAAGTLAQDSSDVATAGQLFTTNTKISSLSNSVSTGFDNFSSSLSTIVKAGGVSSLSTVTEVISGKVSQLQQNALQYNSALTGYDASHATGKPAKITRVAEGAETVDSSDVITGAQLYRASSGYSTSLANVSRSLSSGLNSAQQTLDSLSTSWPEKLNNLSTSTSTTFSSLSTTVSNAFNSLSSTTSNSVAILSSSFSTGLSGLSTSVSNNIANLSTVTQNSLSSLYNSSSTTLGRLSSTVSSTTSTVAGLQQDALQWKNGSYSADHGTDKPQKITNVAAGNVAPDSTDAVNGTQLYNLSTGIRTTVDNRYTSLSTILGNSVSTVSSKLDTFTANTTNSLNKLDTDLSSTTAKVSALQDNALLWNNSLSAYDAGHGGTAQRITNVAAGLVALNSTDAVNGGQLYTLSSSTSAGLSSLSTNLNEVTKNQLGSLSTIVINSLSTVTDNIGSLSTGLSKINGNVTSLQADALQWNKTKGAYVADHGTGQAQNITQVAAGSIAADSTDAVNGAQMYNLSTSTTASVNTLNQSLSSTNVALNTLSTAYGTSLSTLTTGLSSTKDALNKLSDTTTNSITGINNSLSSLTSTTSSNLQILDKGLQAANASVSSLQANALLWNAGKGVYDASRNGEAKVLSGIGAGAVNAASTEAINGGQFYSLSTVTSAGLNSTNSNLSTLSSSTATGLAGLTASLSSTNQNLTTLKANTLQWNGSLSAYDAGRDGSAQRITNISAGRLAADSTDAVNGSQLYTLSNSTSTGLSSLSTNLNEVTKNQLGSLSTIVTNSLSTVTENVSSLSTGLRETNTNVAALQQNALQWNSVSGAFDATRNGHAQKLTGIAGGDISAVSSDAINGAQMYSLSTLTQAGLSSSSTGLSSLSSVTSAGLSTVNERVDTLTSTTQLGLASASTGLTSLSSSTSSGLTSLTSSLSSTNQNLTTLQQNALQWNSSLTAYDASHGGGTAQRITNVAAGRVALDSTDAINGSQLFSLSGSTSTGLSSLSTNLNEVTKNQLGSLSTIVTDSLSTVIKSVSSLSTGLSDTNTNVGNLQKDALQWNNAVNAYDATRGGRAQNLTGIADGNISAGSSDAINGAQMYSLSTLTQAGLNSSSTGLSSLSSATSAGLTNVNNKVDTLTSTTQLGLASASTGLTSLSSSTSSGLTSLTSSLSSTNQNLTTLQQNALQWNSTLGAYDAGHGSGTAQRITNVAAGSVTVDSTDAVNGSQLYALSGSTSTGLNSLSTVVSSTVISGINSISNSMSTGYESLSRSLSTASDSLDRLATNTSTSLSSLSTSFGNTQKDVKELKDKSLQWSDDKNGFDAGRPNKLTRDFDGKYGKIINVADGLVDQDSHDAVNGGQLYTERSRLTSLSTSTSTGLSTITSILQDTPTGEMITNITNLTKNALQWNGTLGAYDASHGSGTAQRITNVAAGNLARGSLDAVNAGQLWDVKTDLDNLSTLVHSLPTGTVSDAQLNSLSTAISQVVGSQIASIASGLGTSYTPGSNAINPPKYDTSTPTGGNVTANNVADALQNIQNYGTKYAKINSAKAASIAQGADSIAVGGAAMASGSSAIAIGDSASAPAANGVALGSNAQVKQSGGVALGSGSVASTAAGKVGYIPVTATSQQAAAIRATRSTEGAVSVGDASKGVYRQITGVAAGTADTDAVNVAQLKGVNNQITNINKYVNQVNERVQRTERRAYSGTALAMALSGAYLPSLNAGEQAVGVGVGTYRGYTAVGANYKAMSNSGNIGWGAGVSTTGKEVGFNAGVGFKWSNN